MTPSPPPGSTARTTQTPPTPAPPSGPASSSRGCMRECVVLVDWWLERVDGKICIAGLTETPQMRKEGSASRGNRKAAARVFRSVVAKRRSDVTIETVNGYAVQIRSALNSAQTRENGFSEEVCLSFVAGFPIKWKELTDSNVEKMDGHSQSPPRSADNAPTKVSGSSNGNTGNSESSKSKAAASEELGDVRVDMPEEPSTLPREIVDREEQGVQHQNMRSCLNECEMRTPECGRTSVNLGIGDAEVPGKGMTPQSGAVQASEMNGVRKLRSGKVLGELSSAPLKSGNKQKRTQHKISSNKKDCSGAGIVSEDKQQSRGSPSKGKGRPSKRRSKGTSKALFTSFL